MIPEPTGIAAIGIAHFELGESFKALKNGLGGGGRFIGKEGRLPGGDE